ncbi:MAG: SRPBCC domain-containing protein [Ignavibacteria bacterium]|jgi:activator of HSP90 ATPase
MKNLTKNYEINVKPQLVYEALTSQETFANWSEQPAEMVTEVHGTFSQFGGNIVGVFLAIHPNKIVQKWKEKNWVDFSHVTFSITEKNSNTMLEIKHNDIPDEHFEQIKNGWDAYYVGPLKKFLEKK